MTRAAPTAEQRAVALAEVREICARLNDQADSWATQLLPNGKYEGKTRWRVGDFANGPGQSLCIYVAGTYQGKWWDFAASPGMRGYSGDILDLIAQVKYGGDKGRAIAHARSVLGMDNLDPERFATETARIQRRQKSASEQALREAEKMRRKAVALFMDPRAVPIVDTPAEWYLAGRGIDLSCLEIHGQQYVPKALAFHPAVWCTEAGCDLAALIARVVLNGQHVATHRTWLVEERGDWVKAPLEAPKKVLGTYAGGHIPLWKGECRETLMRIAPGTDIYSAEGIENGLSVACARPTLRVIASISVSNLGGLVLPEQMGRLVIIGENDAPGSKAEASTNAGIVKHQELGREVAMIRMPADVKDANDILRGAGDVGEMAA
ncbi:toprim domain-containing protein [Sphingomonas sp. LaA6.9]|uniref:DUF7146 domain-containing protein n=1 Tax=Sphingomonas sp. LaA6.9 TaxID=2919914 RepID=UPI001F4FB666|nr:toprim domain-containing protein [Sphingomonas sp. LaA6.9]MCJ8158840.1 toprim domain-containing protein [Sphingomonas sp. LaA6.9]